MGSNGIIFGGAWGNVQETDCKEHLAPLFPGELLTLCTSAWPSGLHSDMHLMGILEVRMAPCH